MAIFDNIEEVKQYLIEEAEYSEERVNNMDSQELVDSVLRWEGLIGFAPMVISLVLCAYNCKEKLE